MNCLNTLLFKFGSMAPPSFLPCPIPDILFSDMSEDPATYHAQQLGATSTAAVALAKSIACSFVGRRTCFVLTRDSLSIVVLSLC